eukprot:3307122-Pyramimonas_sp.AAC.1
MRADCSSGANNDICMKTRRSARRAPGMGSSADPRNPAEMIRQAAHFSRATLAAGRNPLSRFVWPRKAARSGGPPLTPGPLWAPAASESL